MSFLPGLYFPSFFFIVSFICHTFSLSSFPLSFSLSLYCFFCFSVCLATVPCLDPVWHKWLCPLSSQYKLTSKHKFSQLSTLPKTCLSFSMTRSFKSLRLLPVHSCSFYITRTCAVGGMWLGAAGTFCWAVRSLSWSPWLVLHQG